MVTEQHQRYAQWAKSNNSLLIVTWDENDGTSDGNHVATIFYGADVKTGTYATAYNHYNLLSTLLAANNLTGPRNAATAAPIDVFSTSVGGTLAGQVLLSSATEGTAIAAGTTIASFTDTNTSDAAAGFTATITWGDGTSAAGTISGGNGTFAVTGGHTYADEDSDVLSVAVTRTADGSSITPTGTVVVAEGDSLTAHATAITATAGQALSQVTVASFTDVNTGAVAGDFTASIDWGDGTTTVGGVSGGLGTFTVSGSHTYANPGTETVGVTLTDDGPGIATATASSTVQVSSGTGLLTGQVRLATATEGTNIPAGTTIASFAGSKSDTAAGFTATITWGDGTSSAGKITGRKGTFAVTGGHTYADEGSDGLSVTITRSSDGASITPTGTVAVAEGDSLTAHATTITATAGQALSQVTVASFTDVNTGAVAGDFTASINWGDGITTAGGVSGGNGTFAVSGSHTYLNSGTETIRVTLTDDAPGTATAVASSTAQVESGVGGTLAGQVLLSSATEGTAIAAGTTIASFTDTNTSDAAAGFTATITWGDGTSSAGTISGGNGTFAVTGGHTYADEDSDVLSVAVTRTADGSSITPTGTVVVAEGDSLTAHATAITATAGQALSQVTVASFTDVNTGAVAGDFTASIDWGDGTTTVGGVSGGLGTFTVSGSHTYANPGTETVGVTLTDDAPGIATATASSTVQVSSGTGGGGQSISGSVAGPIQLSGANSAVTVTRAGTVTSTGSGNDGIDGSPSAGSTVTNFGTIKAIGGGYSAGIWLENGGSVTNAAEASISAAYGVEVSGGSGVITNSGTMSGSSYAVLFANSATDRPWWGQAPCSTGRFGVARARIPWNWRAAPGQLPHCRLVPAT